MITVPETNNRQDWPRLVAQAVNGAQRKVEALPPGISALGAVGDGTTNDSAAFTKAIAASSNIAASANGFYAIRDIALTSSDSYLGNGTRLSGATGATSLFTLSGYNPRVRDAYVSSSLNCSGASFRFLDSRYAMLESVIAVNGGAGFVNLTPANPSTQAIALPTITNCHSEDITGTGLQMGSSVSELQMVNFHLYGKLTSGPGGQRPMFTTTGWRQNTPIAGGNAVGGHVVANANMITFNRGFWLTDAQLSSFTNCIADSCSDYGVLIDGASQKNKFCDLFVGTTRGIKCAGTSETWFDGLVTILNGVIPPWGSTDFYNGVATFYDLEVRDTAKVRVSNWRGDKRIIVDPGASLIIDDGIRFHFRSVGTVGAGVTGFLAEWGNTGTEADAIWRVPDNGHIVGFYAVPGTAPGAGQNFAYTVRKNFATTGLTGSISGASTFSLEQWCGTSPIAVNKGDAISMQIVTSAGAAATRHNGSMLFLAE